MQQQPVMSTPADIPAPLSPHWAFVVQLRTDTPLNAKDLQGRIEHLVSGQATTFHSLEEIRRFIEQVLSQKKEKPP
jgi:hypothetical protein